MEEHQDYSDFDKISVVNCLVTILTTVVLSVIMLAAICFAIPLALLILFFGLGA